jgi:hypothetical protein
VIQTSGSDAPVVVPLGHKRVSARFSADNESAEASSENTLTFNTASRPGIQVPAIVTSGIFKPDTAVANTRTATSMNLVYTGREVTIRKWSYQNAGPDQEQSKEEVLRLTRLPAWRGLASSSVVVKAPRPGEEKLQVVLNKTTRDWDDMVHDVDVNLPAIVSRDVRTLAVQSRTIEGRAGGIPQIEGRPT